MGQGIVSITRRNQKHIICSNVTLYGKIMIVKKTNNAGTQ